MATISDSLSSLIIIISLFEKNIKQVEIKQYNREIKKLLDGNKMLLC